MPQGAVPDQEILRRRQIMKAVIQCVAEEGVDGATIRRVADQLGVSTGMLTHYYANKKELIAATFDTASCLLDERVDELVGDTFGPERLEKIGELLLSNSVEDVPPVSFWIAFWSEATREPELQQRFVELHLRNRSSNQRSVQTGIDEGEYRDDLDVTLAADLLGALVYGLRIKSALAGPTMRPKRAMSVYR